MNIPQIQIHTTRAQIGMETTNAQVSISQPRAEQHIEQPSGILEIRTTRGQITADSSQAWEELGIYSAPRAIQIMAQKAKADVFEGMRRVAQEGRQLMDLTQKGNKVAQIAKQRFGPKLVQSEMKFIPSVDSVKVYNTPGTTEINHIPQPVKIDVTTHKPEFEYTPGNVETYLVQHPSITIDVVK
ncbi:DUF6470 family protein [Bacillaceae bacterium CLA-AA-H227]|uniref:DUF6470 family protein n=1 Tax=Robertmurraya yapensis (ex Hitch et al 2024) TaxID=3133160 RepID=A0ACC6SBS0_9BACI